MGGVETEDRRALYDDAVHYALRPLTVFVRYWPQLAAFYLLGVLGREGAIGLAAWAGHNNNLWASAIMPLAGLARLGSYVGMFLVIRSAFPELAAPLRRPARQVDLFATVVVPFFAIYLAWQMFKEDWLAFEARALDYRVAEAMTSPGPAVLHPDSLPVGTGTWVLIAGALVTRWALNRLKERLPAWMTGLRLYVDALWVFLVLTLAVNSGLTLLINPSGWVAERRIIVWWNETRSDLFSHVRPLGVVWEAVGEALQTALGGALIPLLWLAVAAIVYGVSAQSTWRAGIRRVVGARADDWYSRATPVGEKLNKKWAKTPNTLRKKVTEYAEAQAGKFRPIIDSARLIAHGGLLGISLYVLAYVALAWLDRSGSFYGTQLGPGYLFRGMAWSLGPHALPFWNGIGDTLSLASHLLIEPLRVCLIATALAFCIHHVAANSTSTSTAQAGPGSDRSEP